MKKHPLVLIAGLVASLAVAACTVEATNPTGTTSGGGGSSTAATAGVTSTSTSTAATSTGAGGGDCKGIFAEGACDTCGEAACCSQGAACLATTGCIGCVYSSDPTCTAANKPVVDALVACLQTSCQAECFPPPPNPVDATCTVPLPTPSNGACVTVGGNIECNPVTNEFCDTAKGESCDFQGQGYHCYPAPNDRKLCEVCGATNNAGSCQGGTSCLPGPEGKCAKFCCNNGDCGAGTCEKKDKFAGGIGYCVGGN